jgi:hypothetical protein
MFDRVPSRGGTPRLFTRTKKNPAVACFENEYLAAVAYLPTLKTRRPRYIFRNGETLVADLLRQVSFDREARTCGYPQRNFTGARPGGKGIEVTFQGNRAITSAGIYLTIEPGNLNRAVAGVHVEFATAVRDFDGPIAGTKRDFTGNSIERHSAIA